MNNSLREEAAQKLVSLIGQPSRCSAILGLDGFVDEIIHVVDKRQHPDSFQRLPTINRLAERLAHAAGKSTNIELVTVQTKLGGNGPIMAHALSSFGVRITYVGNLGYPDLHPVFKPLAESAQVFSIAEPGHTDALEFEDGKIMFGKMSGLNEITWENVLRRVGRKTYLESLYSANLRAFVNWTMTPYMSEFWEALLHELDSNPPAKKQPIFFDLADPEKRQNDDIRRALGLISRFQNHYEVILGMNEKEAFEVSSALEFPRYESSREGLASLASHLQSNLQISAVTIHPMTYALAVHNGETCFADGPKITQPRITTGGGDHFNAGFCLGKLLGLETALCITLGVATSGFYVSTARSPGVEDLIQMLRHWPIVSTN
jgi:hypothetical protein